MHHAATRSILCAHLHLNPRRPRVPATGGLTSARDESTLQSETQSTSMETQSQAARRPKSLPAQRERSTHCGAQRGHQNPQSDSGTSASARKPTSGTCQPAQGRGGLLGSATLFSSAHRLSRCLSRPDLLAWALGIKSAPCPQTIINWVIRLSIVRIEAARTLQGLPLSQAPFTNGLIWMLDISIAVGTSKMLAVLACDAQYTNARQAPSLWSVSTALGFVWPPLGAAKQLLSCSSASSHRWAAQLPTSKTGVVSCKRPLTAGGARTEQPVYRRYLARCGWHAQARLSSASEL